MRKIAWVVGLAVVGTAGAGAPTAVFRPEIPRAWDDEAVEGFEVPLAQRDRSPRYMTAEEYYALKGSIRQGRGMDVPKGFHLGPGAIEGHEYGLDLTAEDRAALIASLKTL